MCWGKRGGCGRALGKKDDRGSNHSKRFLICPFVRIRGCGMTSAGNNTHTRASHQLHVRYSLRSEMRVNRQKLLDSCRKLSCTCAHKPHTQTHRQRTTEHVTNTFVSEKKIPTLYTHTATLAYALEPNRRVAGLRLELSTEAEATASKGG